MLIIRYNNIWAYADGPNSELAKVSHALSYVAKGSRFWTKSKNKEVRASKFKSSGNSFPAGLIPFLLNRQHKWKDPLTEKITYFTIEAELIDERPSFIVPNYQPIDLWDDKTNSPLELFDYQEAAVQAALSCCTGIIKVPARGGKTVCAAALIQTLNLPTLYVVNDKGLMTQAHNEFTNKLQREIGIAGESKWNPQDITVATIQTLSRRLDTKIVQDFLETRQLVIYDEIQYSSKTYQQVSRCMPYAHYRFGLSATPLTGGKQNKLESMALTGPIIYTIKPIELVEKGRLARADAIFLEIDSCPVSLAGMQWADLYDNGIVENEYRNTIFCLAVQEAVAKGYKVLVLTEKLRHGKIFYKLLKSNAPELKVQYIAGNSNTQQRDDAKTNIQSEALDVLITSRIFNVGHDIPDLDCVVVLSGYKAFGLTTQRYTRGSTKTEEKDFSLVIDGFDSSHKLLKKHSEERLKVCERDKSFQVHHCQWNDFPLLLDEIYKKQKR